MLKVCFFARLRESLGTGVESVAVDGLTDVAALMQRLQTKGGVWEQEFSADNSLQVAINHQVAQCDSGLKDGDEVAFFPPVTGG